MAAPNCDDLFCEVIGGVGGVIDGVTGAVSYLQDPWGNTFKALQAAAAGMSKDILPALTSATLPDLSAGWFVNAYRISFATAIFVAIVLLIPQIVATARGTMAGRDLVDSIGLYFGLFLVGAMFGPLAGMILVSFFHALSDVFVSTGVSGSIDSINAQMQKMIAETDPVGITGGVVLATFLMLCMVVGLFMVLLVFLVQLVTLYFTGVLFPLGLVWIISKGKRQFGSKLAWLWLGLLAAHPLMFLLLGLAFSMMANQVGAFGNNFSLQSMVSLLVAVIALFMAALSPLALMKFAPVLPMGSGGSNGPSYSSSSGSDTIGPNNVTEASERYGRGDESEPSTSSTSTTNSANVSTSEPAESESLSKISTSQAAPEGMPAAVPASTAGNTAATAGEAVEAEEALAAAGAAESATGVGAVIGIPTLIVAGTVAATSKAVELTEEAGEMATDAMEEQQIGQDNLS